MRSMLSATCLCIAAASLASQNYLALPATANPGGELGNYSLVPFMQPNSRVQLFYDAAEVGTSPLIIDELSLRFDGPLPQVGASGPFTISRLQIRIGVTGVTAPGAGFAANLTQPLQTVFDGPHTYLPDPGFAAPHPWGAPNGTLSFAFSSPATLVVAPGQWLVVELVVEGNNIASFGFAHAMLDGAPTTGGITNGSTTAYGQGCSASGSAPAATIATSGVFAPGGAHTVTGQNLGANAVALAVFGLSDTVAFAPLPFTLPGTNCTLLASPDFTLPAVTDGSGALTTAQGLVLSLPAEAALNGIVVFEQLASLVPTANPWGLVLSNANAVTLGSYNPLGRGTYLVAHDTNQNAAHANQLRAFGMALRLRTL